MHYVMYTGAERWMQWMPMGLFLNIIIQKVWTVILKKKERTFFIIMHYLTYALSTQSHS